MQAVDVNDDAARLELIMKLQGASPSQLEAGHIDYYSQPDSEIKNIAEYYYSC